MSYLLLKPCLTFDFSFLRCTRADIVGLKTIIYRLLLWIFLLLFSRQLGHTQFYSRLSVYDLISFYVILICMSITKRAGIKAFPTSNT